MDKSHLVGFRRPRLERQGSVDYQHHEGGQKKVVYKFM
jgi:hypothetical protein